MIINEYQIRENEKEIYNIYNGNIIKFDEYNTFYYFIIYKRNEIYYILDTFYQEIIDLKQFLKRISYRNNTYIIKESNFLINFGHSFPCLMLDEEYNINDIYKDIEYIDFLNNEIFYLFYATPKEFYIKDCNIYIKKICLINYIKQLEVKKYLNKISGKFRLFF